MRSIKLSEDVIPVSEFKARAADHLRQIAETGHPIVITQNGKPAGVLVSPKAYDEMEERGRFVEAVQAGVADANAGRTRGHAGVRRAMGKRFKG